MYSNLPWARHEDSTQRFAAHTDALDNNARHTIESHRYKHHMLHHCVAQQSESYQVMKYPFKGILKKVDS